VISDIKHPISTRFRGFLPVVIDVETGGFNSEADALLEIAAVSIQMTEEEILVPGDSWHYHIEPFEGANIETASLEFTGIDPWNPLRGAVSEKTGLTEMYKHIRNEVKTKNCKRAILVGHNAFFDHHFVSAATARNKIKRNPFHPFSCFDTVSLAGLALGQTVLAKACTAANIPFNTKEAHSALYDAQRTAELFCFIVNKWKTLGGMNDVEPT